MNSLSYLFQKTKFLFILLGVGVVLVVLVSLFLPKGTPPQTSPRPSAVVARGLPDVPIAQPQEFSNQNSPQSGSLSVKSNVDGVKVTIDQEEVRTSEFFAPENTAPFVVEKIPAGIHALRASKLGYLNQTQPVEIKPNQIATVNLQMQPDPNFNTLSEATKQMPVSTDEYYIEFLDGIGKIQVIIRKAPFETYKEQAIGWFKERGIENPENSGVLFYPAVNME